MNEAGVGAVPSVLIVGTMHPTVGGITTVVEDHIASLAAEGVQISTVNTGHRLRERPGRPTWENVRSALADSRAVRRTVRQDRPSVTVIHTVGNPLLPLVRCILLTLGSRSAGAKPVIHLHSDLTAALGRRAERAALWVLGCLASRIVVLYQDLAAAVTDIVGRPVAMIPNGIDTDFYEPPATSDAEAEGPVRLVFVGTVGRGKGVPMLLAALRRCSVPVVCTIVGGPATEGPGVYEQVRGDGRDLEDAGTVVFAGEQSRPWIRDELRSSDVFVLPSTGEGLPMALLEAMACGLPAIVTDVGAMGSIVRSADAGVVVASGDDAALAEAIAGLAANPGERRRAGAAARVAVEQTYARPIVIGKLLALYASCEASG